MKKFTIKNMDGTMEEVDLINQFTVGDINKNFVIFSKGEMLKEGIHKVYVSEVVEETPGTFKLTGISDETTWDKVKDTMRSIIQGGQA